MAARPAGRRVTDGIAALSKGALRAEVDRRKIADAIGDLGAAGFTLLVGFLLLSMIMRIIMAVGRRAYHLLGAYNVNQAQIYSNGFMDAFSTVKAGGEAAGMLSVYVVIVCGLILLFTLLLYPVTAALGQDGD